MTTRPTFVHASGMEQWAPSSLLKTNSTTRRVVAIYSRTLFAYMYTHSGSVPGLTNRATLDAYRLEPARMGLVTVNPTRVRITQGQIKDRMFGTLATPIDALSEFQCTTLRLRMRVGLEAAACM